MKTIVLEGIGEVTLRKSRLAKRLILKVDQAGRPVVTIPIYAPYHVAEMFARKHQDWFRQNLPAERDAPIRDGMAIGKRHHVKFVTSSTNKVSARVGNTKIIITHPQALNYTERSVQNEALKGATRALRRQAEAVLPGMLHRLAQAHGYSYNEIRIKSVRTRWGSCSSGKIINLSIWLMQLPEPLTEYVLCHELAHLKHLNHSSAFWRAVELMIPNYKQRRKQLKEYSPRLMQT